MATLWTIGSTQDYAVLRPTGRRTSVADYLDAMAVRTELGG